MGNNKQFCRIVSRLADFNSGFDSIKAFVTKQKSINLIPTRLGKAMTTQTGPLKIFIQDIFRATQTENKYIYEFLGLRFKNVMIHGVVTSVYNTTDRSTNLELSDPTGTVQCYFDSTKSNSTPTCDMLNNLNHHFVAAAKFGDPNMDIISKLMHRIKKKKLDIVEGNHLSVVGDIFVDAKGQRMVSVYDCKVTSVDRDIVWLEELRYLYDKFYLWTKKENEVPL